MPLSLCQEQEENGSKVDLILLDYKLGDMAAEEVATKIKGVFRGTRVILTTALDLDEATSPILSRENLIDSQLKKPFSATELVSKVAQYM
jgi:response regulator RpfG family c-di-GMP phosphodiesterase